MERRVRYEVLRTEEDDADFPVPPPMESVDLTAVAAPAAVPSAETAAPPVETEEFWSCSGAGGPSAHAITPGEMAKDAPVPPSYEMATTLPSYEEAEQSKQDEMEKLEQQRQHDEHMRRQNPRDIDRFPDMQLGTDGMFLCMFILAFLFNWIGLLAAICMTHTVAGRFGAISGFGLSMVKWVAIVKHNNWASGVAEDNSWLWWLLIILGFLIFFRGCTQYLRIKYQWTQLSAHLRQRTYFLF